jgi:hypothetical protein
MLSCASGTLPSFEERRLLRSPTTHEPSKEHRRTPPRAVQHAYRDRIRGHFAWDIRRAFDDIAVCVATDKFPRKQRRARRNIRSSLSAQAIIHERSRIPFPTVAQCCNELHECMPSIPRDVLFSYGLSHRPLTVHEARLPGVPTENRVHLFFLKLSDGSKPNRARGVRLRAKAAIDEHPIVEQPRDGI